jgi:hypothetical protein
VITPRWLYVLASATPAAYGTPVLTDQTLEPVDTATIQRGDVVGIGTHTGMPCAGLKLERQRARPVQPSSLRYSRDALSR